MNMFTPSFTVAVLDPFLIPIFGIVFGCAVAIVAIVTNYQRRRQRSELYHRERMAAIEKGVDLPPPPQAFLDDGSAKRSSAPAALFRGLVWFFVGVALLFALPRVEEDLALVGLVPMAVGAAYLLYYALAGRKEAERAATAEKARFAETIAPPRV